MPEFCKLKLKEKKKQVSTDQSLTKTLMVNNRPEESKKSFGELLWTLKGTALASNKI